MRIPGRRDSAMRGGGLPSIQLCLLTIAVIAPATHGSLFSPNPIEMPALDTSQLGRMGIVGGYAGLSLYEYEGQTEQLPSTNGADALMTSLPNGLFHSVASTDATVKAMCVFGTSAIIGGNFTSVNGTESPAIAALDLTTGSLSPLAGISGEVTSLYCDNDAGMVYVGGSFRAADSLNAITWVKRGNWASLPFAGFNGPISSITKAANGHIIFGGDFTGLGNASTTKTPDSEPINIGTADVEGFQSTTDATFSNAENVVCNSNGESGKSWLLLDGTPGAWRAGFGFGFIPTKLRLRNTRQPDRGTKTWRMTALPLNGIMNFTYTDPASGQKRSCTSTCPLSNDPNVPYQDFYFVNPIGMNAMRIDISEWYGKGAGLDGVEIFQDALVAHAINSFNSPNCPSTKASSLSTQTGPWTNQPSGQSSSDYLKASVPVSQGSSGASVVFYPPIAESGSYSVVMYTPGCIVDGTCRNRGQIEVITHLKANEQPTTTTLYQTNDFDKYDQIAFGEADPISGSFRPSVTLRPLANQSLQGGVTEQVIVAQAVTFWLTSSTDSGLNGLFEYDPSQTTINDEVQKSKFVKLASTFRSDSSVSALVTAGDLTYIGGNFSSQSVGNIAAISNTNQDPLSIGGGLNGAVSSLLLSDDGKLYVGGDFTGSQGGSATTLDHIAVYDTAAKSWSPLGAGVDGFVKKIVPMVFNMSGISEEVITFSGTFKNLLAFGNNTATPADGFAVWVKSQRNWLQNAEGALPLLRGHLSASLLAVENSTSLYAGTLSAQALRANDIATFASSIGSFPVDILTDNTTSATTGNSIVARASVLDNVDDITGVTSGVFYKNDQGGNITVLAGHFTAKAADGSSIQNLVLVDGANSNAVTGLPQGISNNSTFLALATQGDTLFAGGRMNGTISGSTVTGVLSYNLASKSFNKQPPALSGDTVTVSSILVRPDTTDVYVGGAFESAGSLPCPAVCVFSTTTNQWSRPGFSLDGETRSMIWSSNTVLVAGGLFKSNGSTQYLASFDAVASTWSTFPNSSSIPGPVDAVTIATSDGSQLWIAGADSQSKSFLMKYDGQSWKSTGVSFQENTIIQSLQMYTLSSNHDDTETVPGNQVLMLTGSIGIPGFGTASVALFDGTSLKPFVLSTDADGKAGHVSKFFVENPSKFFTSNESGMALGFIVLIALAISLGLMLMIVVAGLALDRYRKKREGYIPAPTSMLDRGNGIQRVPPHELLNSLNQGRSASAPHV